MIKRVRFSNFRALRHTELPLGPFTLLVGPNGSGKSTALRAIAGRWQGNADASAGIGQQSNSVRLTFDVGGPALPDGVLDLGPCGGPPASFSNPNGAMLDPAPAIAWLKRSRIYELSAYSLCAPVRLEPQVELQENGAGLAGVLDRLRDTHPERFEALNAELARWLPEFDRVLFATPETGLRAFLLRTRQGRHEIAASDLSQGTVLALALLTLAFLPDPPPLVCIEEPDRGLHPRLLREVRDAMDRLSSPASYGEPRAPVQVVATTHSPYMLDLYSERPEEIVVAHKLGSEATFERLSDRPDLADLLDGAHLGEIWYSGVLGGVPAEP
jgi:predicted ATPase